MYKVDNAIIMAAGTSSRFAPLSYEIHKGLIKVKGEVLVERQIRQLREAGIPDIILVTGYKARQFEYLKEKFGIKIVYNPAYLKRNNNSSIYAVRNYLHNSYVCSVDDYFKTNPFRAEVEDSYYAAEFADQPTKEWCMTEGQDGYVNSVRIGGNHAWYMMGHTFWNEHFSKAFLSILKEIYNKPEVANLLWESIYMKHLDVLKMKIRKYPKNDIFEFDTLDELRKFDHSYVNDTRSKIIKNIAISLRVKERNITNLKAITDTTNEAIGFKFLVKGKKYKYFYDSEKLMKI